MTETNDVLMVGKAGELCGIHEPWKVRRTIERGFFPEPARMGPFRVIPRSDLPLLKQALVAAGYLQVGDAPL
jgi:hypothetical protein